MKKVIKCPFRIVSSGSYLPQTKITAKELSLTLNVSESWILKSTGVETRYFAGTESIASMAAKAIENAMKKSGLKYEDIDLLIAASGTPDQPIPHNSALIHHELKLPKNITPFDVNGTCLSFSHALMVAAGFLNAKLYKNIIVVSSEKPSVGLNNACPESAALFGDGAVAFIITSSDKDQGLMFSDFETYNEGVHLTQIQAGGTRFHPKDMDSLNSEHFLFKMEGQKIYKLASLYLQSFLKESLTNSNSELSDFKIIVPHQASLLALNIMQSKLGIPKEKFYINVNRYGNLVAASIPMSLHELMENKTIVEGDQVLLLSTAAGLTLGCMGIKL